jgi:hypothetical protein
MGSIEPLIALLIGSGLAAGATWVSRIIAARKLVKYGPILARAYDIIDPLLERNMRGWDGSNVEFALELAIKSVADGDISPAELKEIVTEAGKRWLPTIAADKVRKYEQLIEQPKELQAADIIAKAVNGSTDPRDAVGQVQHLFQK